MIKKIEKMLLGFILLIMYILSIPLRTSATTRIPSAHVATNTTIKYYGSFNWYQVISNDGSVPISSGEAVAILVIASLFLVLLIIRHRSEKVDSREK